MLGTADIPKRTATVISSQPASVLTRQASLYGTSGSVLEPVPGFESDCTVTVQYKDGTTGTVSAAEEARSLIEEWGLNVASLGTCGATALWLKADSDGKWKKANERHEELLNELHVASAGRQSGAEPPSGEYWGSSEESDGGDQSIRSFLTFRSYGHVTGRGNDGVDGAYRITRGRWGLLDGDTEPTVAWIEKYDEGFEVVVEGSFDARDGKIHARFTSSRGVRGTFVLGPKPNVF